jgi:glycosyltransferase involved in cell wall biosynthesis
VKKFELVLPAYNEAESLPGLVGRAVDAAKEFGFTSLTFGLVLVNNGSTDDTKQVLGRLLAGETGAWVHVVDVYPNEGYGHGILAGLHATSAPVVAWSHADTQCDPRDAFRGYALVAERPTRFVRGERSGRRRADVLVTRVFELLALVLLRKRMREINAQPKVFRRDLLAHLDDPPKNFAFDLYVLYQALRHGYEVTGLPVQFPPRVYGRSKWAANFLSRYRTILGMIGYMAKLGSSD